MIGIGSPFGADRLGWELVDAMSRHGALAGIPVGMLVFSRCDRPGAVLQDLFAAPGLVILIDAMCSGRTPGTVCCFSADEVMRTAPLISTHDFGIKSALSMATALGGPVSEILVVGIEIPCKTRLECSDIGGDTGSFIADRIHTIILEINKILIAILSSKGYMKAQS